MIGPKNWSYIIQSITMLHSTSLISKETKLRTKRFHDPSFQYYTQPWANIFFRLLMSVHQKSNHPFITTTEKPAQYCYCYEACYYTEAIHHCAKVQHKSQPVASHRTLHIQSTHLKDLCCDTIGFTDQSQWTSFHTSSACSSQYMGNTLLFPT